VDWGYREKPCCIIVFCSVCFEHRWGVQVYDERGEEFEESDKEATTPVPSKQLSEQTMISLLQRSSEIIVC
jgi:hypothetical protein